MNRLTKTIAAIIAVCLLSVSGVAFAYSDCNNFQNQTLDAVIDLLERGSDEEAAFAEHLQGISCGQIAFHFRNSTMANAPACEGTTTCTSIILDDEGGGDITDCVVIGDDNIVSCN